MKRKWLSILIVVCMLMTAFPLVANAASKSASHHKVTYTSTNVSKITYDSKRSYVTTKASFNWGNNTSRWVNTDVLTQCINNGFMMTSGSGSIYMKPTSVFINGQGQIALTSKNEKKIKKYISNANYKKIINSGYNSSISVKEKEDGKTYAYCKMSTTNSKFCKDKAGRYVKVNYVCTKGSYTVKWRRDGKAYSYNLYSNYGYSGVNAKPTVSFKGWDVSFSSKVYKGDNAILRISQ